MNTTVMNKVRNLASGAVAEIKDKSSVEITVDEFLGMFQKDDMEWAKREVDGWDLYDTPQTDLETHPRDIALEIFAVATTGMPWPCMSDSEEVNSQFATRLAEWVVKKEQA